MNETEWDIQEVKRLKWKQLVQYNVLMLLLFLLFMGRKFILPFLEFIVLGLMGYSCTQSLYFFYRENDRNKNNEACASF